MKKLIKYFVVIALGISLTQCEDYLKTSSPSNSDDVFVTTTPGETFKTLSWCYANYRQNCIMGGYRWNEPVGSDAEYYPEAGSSNNIVARLRPELLASADAGKNGFNELFITLARATVVAELIAKKPEYLADLKKTNPTATAWTQLYGEAITMRAMCYFDLLKHFGDLPYGYENTIPKEYSLTSRFEIYDKLIESLIKVEPLMYKVGEGGITAERLSRTYCNALIGQLSLFAGGYQTIRTDVPGLYGNVTFVTKGKEEKGCIYARRTDYLTYYTKAKTYLQQAIDNKGSVSLITTDTRTYSNNNPFQLHFQYFADKKVSPESLLEIGNIQGGQTGQTTTSEYPYAFGRPSNGGSSNAAPCKVFGALRIVPTVYYGEFEIGDKRRDVSVAVTGSNGDGNEAMLNFKPGSKLEGGLSTNKWDDNRMNPPYTAAQRLSGMNWPILRMADVILMLAEAKAELGEVDAIDLVNQIRARAFGTTARNLSGLTGDALKAAVMKERKLELLGEGTRRWDLIRSGKMAERAVEVRQEMQTMIAGLTSPGYYTFANGNVISSHIYTKKVALATVNPLTYESVNVTDPALYPGWRGQFDYLTIPAISSKVKGTTRNVAILGLFNYLATAPTGYTKTNWGVDLVANSAVYMENILSGVATNDQPPRYFYPLPYETVFKSNGKITNGYGLPQQ